MSMTKDKAKSLLRAKGLRVTEPRLAVLQIIAKAESPRSHSEVVNLLGEEECDPATIYRNLIKLREVGLVVVVARANGIDRYALAEEKGDGHRHPHFLCDDCGRVLCLSSSVTPKLVKRGRWAASVRQAKIQLRGACPDCLDEVR